MLFDVWSNLFDWWSGFWQQWQTLIRIILIVGGAALLRVILLALVRRTVSRIVAEATRGVNPNLLSPLVNARLIQRAQTLGSVLTNFITWGLVLGAVTAVLSELGVAVGAIIAGAGILGAALGFGAQLAQAAKVQCGLGRNHGCLGVAHVNLRSPPGQHAGCLHF